MLNFPTLQLHRVKELESLNARLESDLKDSERTHELRDMAVSVLKVGRGVASNCCQGDRYWFGMGFEWMKDK